MKHVSLLLLGAACVVLPQASLAQDEIYGVTFFSNELISINPATGAGTLVGPLGATVSPYGLAERSGSLYTFNPNTSLVQQVDPATGQVSGGISIGVGVLRGEGDLAFRSDGLGFLSSALDADFNPVNDLFSFDLVTGTSQRIGSTSVTLDGLVFDGNTLYALGQGAGVLYTVNTVTAALTEIGSLGVDQNSPVAGLTLTSSGMLLGAIDDRLFSIDKLTGMATLVDPNVLDFGFSSVSGIAVLKSSSAVPDVSSTAGLLSLAMVGFALLGRKVQTTT